jgi:prevent-host-death family protein
MKTMGISEFKARALKVIDLVAKTKEGVIITRRGKPLAQVLPFAGAKRKQKPGTLAHTLAFEKDIVAPLGPDMWEAAR